MTPTVRFPAGPVTPAGAYYILNDRIPQVALRAYDDTVVLNMMGGLSIANPRLPERVEIKELRGLIPPWTTIDQKGATQDGTTFVDALYDPTEITMTVRVVGRNAAYRRMVKDYLVASLDVKQQSELSWFTHKMGRWWAPVRWFKAPDDPESPIKARGEIISLRLRADSAFWQSYPYIDEFKFAYSAASDDFAVDHPSDLGTGWTIAYSGSGSGIMYADGGEAKSTLTGDHHAVARKVSYTSSTDNQVAEVQLGTLPGWFFDIDAFDEVWVRMKNTGTPGQDGVRLRFGFGSVRVSSFNAGVETVLREHKPIIPPLPNERWRIVAGDADNPRRFRVFRGQKGGAPVPRMDFVEAGTTSQVGSTFRSAGIGMIGGITRPAAFRNWSVGDNTTLTQSGFLKRVNVGDQPYWDRYTCFGPGTFRFGNGPGSTEMVEFGPLLPNQIMQIRTDPRKRGVKDMTVIPPTPQELNRLQQALKDFLDFASGNNVSPLGQQIESKFGIKPPQGNPYSLLKGRFSQPIPAKPAGKPASAYHVKVEIVGGNADSHVIAAGTPLRRLPY